MIDLAAFLRNQRAADLKHFNECKRNFTKDNREDIENMFLMVKQKQPVVILSGPCAGMVIKTRQDVYAWIDKHTEKMADPWA